MNINIRDFVLIEKRFLGKNEDLKIYTALEVDTPFDIYINGELYGLQVSLQPEIPHTINRDNFNIGYNEIRVDDVVFGITKGYDDESNIISINNCNFDSDNIYAYGGESLISISKNEETDMNAILDIYNILGDPIITKEITKNLLSNKDSNKMYYENILNNIDSVNRSNMDISKYKYFRIEFDTQELSELNNFACINDNGDTFSIEDNDQVFIIQDHNFLNTDSIGFLLYGDETDEVIEFNSEKPSVFFEFLSDVAISGFDILYNNIDNLKVYGKELSTDSYNLIFENSLNNFNHTVNLGNTDYISAVKVGDNIYTIGASGDMVLNEAVSDFDESLSYLPPMSDTEILSKVIGDIDDIIFYNSVVSLNLKESEIEYGVIAEIDGEYVDGNGVLGPDIHVHKFDAMNLNILPSNAIISYYINSDYPIVLKLDKTPTVIYYIKNNISLDNYELTPDTIHDEYSLLKITSSNDYELETYVDIFINNKLSDSILIDNGFDLQKAYGYDSDHIQVGNNAFKTIITDMLGYQLTSNNINLQFNNVGPSIVYKINDFNIEITISDNDGDDISYKVLMNDELVSYNKPYRPIPYTDIFEWDNFKYNNNDSVSLSIIADDKVGGSTTVSSSIKIKDKGIMVLDRLNRPINNQFKEQILKLDIGTLISNIPISTPFTFQILNQSGYDLYNLNISRYLPNEEDEPIDINDNPDIIFKFRLLINGSYTEWYDNIGLYKDKFKQNEIMLVEFKLDGESIETGVEEGQLLINISANIREER